MSVKIAEVTVPKCQAKAQLSEMQIASTLKHPNVVGAVPLLSLVISQEHEQGKHELNYPSTHVIVSNHVRLSPLQVHTHVVLAERVRPSKSGLHSRVSAGSTGSSEGFGWPEGAATSPGETSTGSSEAALSYNRVPSSVRCI